VVSGGAKSGPSTALPSVWGGRRIYGDNIWTEGEGFRYHAFSRVGAKGSRNVPAGLSQLSNKGHPFVHYTSGGKSREVEHLALELCCPCSARFGPPVPARFLCLSARCWDPRARGCDSFSVFDKFDARSWDAHKWSDDCVKSCGWRLEAKLRPKVVASSNAGFCHLHKNASW
jgi:hypothetical protein